MGGTLAPRTFSAPGAIPSSPQGSNPVSLQPSGPIPGSALRLPAPPAPVTQTPIPRPQPRPITPIVSQRQALGNVLSQRGSILAPLGKKLLENY